MHSLFRVDAPLPVPAGEGPFHIRGIYYDRLASFYRKSRWHAAFAEALGPELRDFMGQRFRWMEWYDVFPALPVCAAMAEVAGRDFEEATREQTRRGAAAVVPSFFRLALRVPSPAAFDAQTAKTVSTFVDFVDLELDRPGPAKTSGWGRRVPQYIAPHTANLVVGFFQAVQEIRYRKPVRARYTDVVRDGERKGFETVSIRYEFSWDG